MGRGRRPAVGQEQRGIAAKDAERRPTVTRFCVFAFPLALAFPPTRHPTCAINMTAPALTGAQKSYLRSLGQTMDCGIAIGKDGVSRTVVIELEKLFGHHELVKVKLNAEREERVRLCARIEAETGAVEAGAVGKTALFYRQHPDPERRTIALPEPKTKPVE